MKEQFLKRKLNPFLLITTVLVLAILAGSSVFYQSELSDLVSTRKQLNSELDNKTQNLESLREMNANLNETIRNLENSIREKNSEINSKEQRITELENTLERIRGQNQARGQRINQLNQSVNTLNGSLSVICTSNSSLTDEAEANCEINGY